MPKAKITRDMVIDAAFAVARAEGVENVNARTVAQKLGCSTQPVMYHFATIGALKRAVYEKTDRFHTEYLMDTGQAENPSLEMGLNYIRFGMEEPHLFRLLFQSGLVPENSVPQMMDAESLGPVLDAMGPAMKLDREQTKKAFLFLSLFVHGYASILANNALTYDEETIKAHLLNAFRGAVLAAKEEKP